MRSGYVVDLVEGSDEIGIVERVDWKWSKLGAGLKFLMLIANGHVARRGVFGGFGGPNRELWNQEELLMLVAVGEVGEGVVLMRHGRGLLGRLDRR